MKGEEFEMLMNLIKHPVWFANNLKGITRKRSGLVAKLSTYLIWMELSIPAQKVQM